MAKHDSPLMPSRLAKRARLDKDTIYAILDESLYCTISYSSEGQPFS
ncbi:MAG: pyridoxamine 5'-phosphate oxidase family protein, partial [Bacteroidetes bacterium]|nr:pyridoxamine 5'-phosphate oxidase family protein [Bacteroidota bacterium]